MSWKALAWATEQTVGSTARKLVLIMLADAAHKETHLAWLSIETLSKDVEADPRTVRQALKDLQTSGHLADTGKRTGRQKNVTVWNFPLFEAQLAANPDKNVGVDRLPASEGAQPAEVVSKTGTENTGNPQPSQNCQGSENPTPTVLQPNPLKTVSGTLTKVSGDPNLNHIGSVQSAPARATPSGSRDARKSDGPAPYDEIERGCFWRSTAAGTVIDEAVFQGVCIDGLVYAVVRGTTWSALPERIRVELTPKVNQWVAWAIEHEMARSLAYKLIEERVRKEMRDEMRAFKPPTPAERSSVAA